MNRENIRALVDSHNFQSFIIGVIVVNAFSIGLQTFDIPEQLDMVLDVFDALCLLIYVVEIALRIYAHRGAFFRDGWSVFDFVVVALSILPSTIIPFPAQIARVLRVFRIARVFRLVSAFEQMRVIIEAIGKSIPGVMWTGFLLVIVMYIFDVIGVSLFGSDFPAYFGDLGTGMFTLFQFVTLEGWPDIAREIIEAHPYAWAYFVPYIVITAMIIINVVVGIIVNTIEESTQAARIDQRETLDAQLATELDELKAQIATVEYLLDKQEKAKRHQK